MAYGLNPTYDATKGALQHDPTLREYGYNVHDNYSRQSRIIKLKDSWGAVSISKTKPYWDSVSSLSSQKKVKKETVKWCEEASGAACSVVASYRHGCASVAGGEMQAHLYRVFGGWSGISEEADYSALEECRKDGATDCSIVMTAECSYARAP